MTRCYSGTIKIFDRSDVMLAQTPPMGWNTWNTFGSNINEDLIKESADAFLTNGLKEAGYQYLIIDDCWSERERDSVTGKIIPCKTRFPNGILPISDYIHQNGLKFGMYSCSGIRTCANFPGSFDHEFLDAQTFAEYGCDYLKYDYCFRPETSNGKLLYYRMGMALRATGREILFSACNWGKENAPSWMRSAGAHMYRSTGDIFDNYVSFTTIARSQFEHLCCSAPGCFNDLDMLTVGMYGKGLVGTTGCNDADYRTQFSLWCMCSAPLILGCDIRRMSDEIKSLVTNKELIRIDQDPEARPPIVFSHPDIEDRKILIKFLSNGEYAFGFFNLTEEDGDIFVALQDMGLTVNSGYRIELTDLFTGENAGIHTDRINVDVLAHDCRIFRGKLVRE